MNDYIEVNTSVENPEYPTRVRIIGYNGTFEHAGDYSAPRYDFSVQVEVRYNKVVDGKEEVYCRLAEINEVVTELDVYKTLTIK